MQFPNTPETRLTEKIMAEVRAQNPKMDTSTYNRTFTAVYSTLKDVINGAPSPEAPPAAKHATMSGIAPEVLARLAKS